MDSNNKEMILKELTDFEKNSENNEEITETLEKYLNNIARTGNIIFNWEQIKPLIKRKIILVVDEFNEKHPCVNLNQPNVRPFDYEEVKCNILTGIDSFQNSPFTIQRICELLTEPYKHYRRVDKFMKGLEKNVMVITEETFDQKIENGNNSISNYLNSTFTLQPPSTSDSINNNNQPICNGFKDNQTENNFNQSINNNFTNNNANINQQPPIQQLDSFTTVFVSQTHLEEIENIQIFDSTTSIESKNVSNTVQSSYCLPSSSSVTITSTDPLEEGNNELLNKDLDLDKSTESEITVNVIENVNNEQQNQEEIINKVEETDELKNSINDNLQLESNLSTDDKKDVENSNQNVVKNENDDKVKQQTEEEEEIKKEDHLQTPIKENNSDLKRVCELESPDCEISFKRFKTEETDVDEHKLNQSDELLEEKVLIEKENQIQQEDDQLIDEEEKKSDLEERQQEEKENQQSVTQNNDIEQNVELRKDEKEEDDNSISINQEEINESNLIDSEKLSKDNEINDDKKVDELVSIKSNELENKDELNEQNNDGNKTE